MFKENEFHWLFTTVVYQQIENSERANEIHRFTIDHCKFTLKIIIIRQISGIQPKHSTNDNLRLLSVADLQRSAQAINQKGKTRIGNLKYGPRKQG